MPNRIITNNYINYVDLLETNDIVHLSKQQ
jgi:hypothetical protein